MRAARHKTRFGGGTVFSFLLASKIEFFKLFTQNFTALQCSSTHSVHFASSSSFLLLAHFKAKASLAVQIDFYSLSVSINSYYTDCEKCRKCRRRKGA